MSSVSLLDQGKYIITQVSDCLLIWDAAFNNIGHVYGIGGVYFSNSQFLAFNDKNELVVMKRVPNFNNDFDSSVFKERTGENSNIYQVGS